MKRVKRWETIKAKEMVDILTKVTTKSLPDYKFTELKMPNGEIQHWWTGNDESIIIKWKAMNDRPRN